MTARSGFELVQTASSTGSNQTIAIYPNPVHNQLKLLVDTEKPQSMTADVFDLQGRRLQSVRYALVSGNQQLQLNVAQLPSGTYLLKTSMGAAKGAKLFQKQ